MDGTGAPNIERIYEAMESEHTKKPGSDVEFTTSNYKITTTPRNEWEYVVKKKKVENDLHLKFDRRIPDIEKLLKDDETVKGADLSEDEVISVVLFTGPMVS